MGDRQGDPDVSGGHHRFQFNFTWFELGASIPFKEKKLQDLPYGMNTYLYAPRTAFTAGGFGFGLYYRDHWGISVIYTNQNYPVDDTAFRNYIASQYPGHYLPNDAQARSFSLSGFNYRLGYRIARGHVIWEPQIQLGVTDAHDPIDHFVLKADGSNQFIEYDIAKEGSMEYTFSYHAALKVIWVVSKPERKWYVEPGLRLDVMIAPTDSRYTITSTPYQMPATVHTVDVKQMHPAVTITAFLSFFKT